MTKETITMYEKLLNTLKSPFKEIIMGLTLIATLAYGYGGYQARTEMLTTIVEVHSQEIKLLTKAMQELKESVIRLDERLKREDASPRRR